MRAWIYLLPIVCVAAGAASARQAGPAGVDLKALKSRAIPGFSLKKTTAVSKRVVEQWERGTDGVQLRIEIVPRADDALVEAQLKASGAKIKSPQSEEQMFRYASSGDMKAWTNYRADHKGTYKTYRVWKLQKGMLVMADISFPRGKPNFDAAQQGFVAAKKAVDSTLQALSGPGGAGTR